MAETTKTKGDSKVSVDELIGVLQALDKDFIGGKKSDIYALVVHDYFNGTLMEAEVIKRRGYHYFNELPGGRVVDFKHLVLEAELGTPQCTTRERILASTHSTKTRYDILSRSVNRKLNPAAAVKRP
ncbi:Uncharacterised protein [uncultured archaeon]|nr:Uncharacterised protein [uncultured archaeon]